MEGHEDNEIQKGSLWLRSPLEAVFQCYQLVHYLAGRCVRSRLRSSPKCHDVRVEIPTRQHLFSVRRGQRQMQDDHVPDWVARQAPKYVPLLLVADRSAADRDRVRGDQLPESRKRWIFWINGESEAEIACGVLVPDVGYRGVWEHGETFKRGVHLCACTFEEDATARDEERVAREDHTGGLGSRCVRGGRRVGHVVADRVLGVAGRCDTPGESRRS